MLRTLCRLIPLAVLLALSTNLFGHPDDPKALDQRPPTLGPGYRSSGPSRGGPPNFPSQGVTLLAWLPISEFGSHVSANDCWGYTSPSGREYAIIGLSGGTGFVEITDPGNPQVLALVPGPGSIWRDIKVYRHHAYVVSEGGDGIQVVDMSQIDSGVVNHLGNVTTGGSTATHNVAINEDSSFLYRTGGGFEGLRIYSLADPANPVFVASWPDRYVHDAQVVTYFDGPYQGREIAFCCSGFNGGFVDTGIDILDVTDKSDIILLARYEYPDAAYSSQAWLSEDRQYLILSDERDEIDLEIETNTKVLDVSDLTAPFLADTFTNNDSAIDHNLYVVGDVIFEANYASGLRVFDFSDPFNVVETAFFDTSPDLDGSFFNGLWSNYPYFPSGTVIGSDRESGLFVWSVDVPPLEIGYPTGRPQLLNPLGDRVRVRIEEVTGTVQAGTQKIHIDVGSGFVTADLVSLGGDLYEGVFPAIPCGETVSYYVTAEDTTGVPIASPFGAPAERVFSALSAVSVTEVVVDTMEVDLGWTPGTPGDTATSGVWVRVEPIGTGAQPQLDHTLLGGQAWVTGQGSSGGTIGGNDVDDGVTTLLSPIYDLSGLSEPRIGYWRWFSNDAGGSPSNDIFEIDISNDGGSNWTSVEVVGPSGPDASGGWVDHEFTVADFVTPTSAVQLRFVAHDDDISSIVEAAIDDLTVTDLACYQGETPDLSIEHIRVDYDPGDPDIDAGPGFIGQGVNVIVTVQNRGNIPVLSADLQVDASVLGGSTVQSSITVTDFGPEGGDQALDPTETADLVVPFVTGALDRCGSYTISAFHVPGNLQSQGGGGIVAGDSGVGNDQRSNPDALELEFGTLIASIEPVSETIEDLATERLRVAIDFAGLGPGMDAHDVEFSLDLLNPQGIPHYRGVFSRQKNGVRSNGSRVIVIRVSLDGLTPPIPAGSIYRVRARLRDRNSNDICVEATTANTTTVQ